MMAQLDITIVNIVAILNNTIHSGFIVSWTDVLTMTKVWPRSACQVLSIYIYIYCLWLCACACRNLLCLAAEDPEDLPDVLEVGEQDVGLDAVVLETADDGPEPDRKLRLLDKKIFWSAHIHCIARKLVVMASI